LIFIEFFLHKEHDSKRQHGEEGDRDAVEREGSADHLTLTDGRIINNLSSSSRELDLILLQADEASVSSLQVILQAVRDISGEGDINPSASRDGSVATVDSNARGSTEVNLSSNSRDELARVQGGRTGTDNHLETQRVRGASIRPSINLNNGLKRTRLNDSVAVFEDSNLGRHDKRNQDGESGLALVGTRDGHKLNISTSLSSAAGPNKVSSDDVLALQVERLDFGARGVTFDETGVGGHNISSDARVNVELSVEIGGGDIEGASGVVVREPVIFVFLGLEMMNQYKFGTL
jgi:hypothetical protein